MKDQHKCGNCAAAALDCSLYHFFSGGLGVGLEQDSAVVSGVLQLYLLFLRHTKKGTK